MGIWIKNIPKEFLPNIMLDELDKGREAFYESYFIERSKK